MLIFIRFDKRTSCLSTLLAYAYTSSAQGMGLKTGNFGPRVLTFKQSSHTAIFIKFRAFAKLRDEANSMRFDCRVSRPTLHFHCWRNMRSRFYSRGLSVRPSVCLSHYSTAAAACGEFAAKRRAPSSNGYVSTARCRSTELSSKSGQCHVVRRVDNQG